MNPKGPEAAWAPKRIGRRLFLSVLGLGAIGVAIGSKLQGAEARLITSLTGKSSSGVGALVPGASDFRIYSVTNSFPVVKDDSYRLDVGGLVASERVFTLDDLKSLPATTLHKTFQCVTGWTVPDVEWKGVLLRDLLKTVEIHPEATAVEFYSFDGVYTESLTLDEAHRSDVLVAYEMLGAPVTVEHGGPVRLYVAPMYGYKSIKWLGAIRLVKAAIPGYWEQNGYDVEAWIGRSNGLSGPGVD